MNQDELIPLAHADDMRALRIISERTDSLVDDCSRLRLTLRDAPPRTAEMLARTVVVNEEVIRALTEIRDQIRDQEATEYPDWSAS